MSAKNHRFGLSEISVLLRGESQAIAKWSGRWNPQRFALHTGMIVLGAGLYGAAMGWWRAPQQGLYVAIKFPLIILLTTFGNALINGMLAPLLGLNIPFRQSFSVIVMSNAITAAIMGAFSPLVLFLIWNAPPMSASAMSGNAYSVIKLTHVAAIMFAGMVGNLRLLQLLQQLGGGRAVARRVMFAWLAGNLLLGSQLSWDLRPFIGAPALPVQFIRDGAMHGSFFENVLGAITHFFQSN